jgi:predicted ATPase/transcriptional regulator with XRE-family HTH domain/Tfp pilus assembly protein PilF
MPASPTLTLNALLKHFRVTTGLTQDELAERARISVRAISDLERGVRRAPHKDTLLLLADALSLDEENRTLLLETAREARAGGASPTSLASSLAVPVAVPCSREIPAALTPLIGRERDEALVAHLLSQEDVRLLTLTGPAGIGKTRLAAQVATTLRDRFADGAVFVSLADIGDHCLVLPAIAQALGLKESRSQPADERLRNYLAERELLLVLDNFEQVARAGPTIAQVLAACPRVKALFTSRAALRVRGEQEFAVPPLDLPDLIRLPTLGDLVQFAAVALFVHRAQAANPTFALTPALAPTVAAICVRLDGIPLAIELAAARIKLLAPPNLLARLDPSLALLTHGPTDLPARQQTMRRAITWSYDLLGEDEQRLFRQLAVFAGSWTLEAAETICARGDLPAVDLLDNLTTLVDESLVVEEAGADGEPRFRLLELIREYAWERLAQLEAADLQRRHAGWYLALAEQAEPELHGDNQSAWLIRLSGEHTNLRAALRWAEETGAVEVGLRLGGALWWFWQLRSHMQEGRAWLERFLALQAAAGFAGGAELRANALKGAGNLAWYQGDYGPAEELLEASLRLYRDLADAPNVAHVLNTLGLIADGRGDSAQALALYEECLALRRDLQDSSGIACVLNNLAIVACRQEQYAQAIPRYEESLALHRMAGDKRGTIVTLGNLGTVALLRGELERAAALLEESLALSRELGDTAGIAAALSDLGAVAREWGEMERAAQLYHESIVLAHGVGLRAELVESMDGAGEVAYAQGRATQATRIFALATELRERYQIPRSGSDQTPHTSKIATLLTVLGEEAFVVESTAGRTLTVEQAAELLCARTS